MLAKLELYANTIRSMKASQIYYRIRKMLKLDCSIGCVVASDVADILTITDAADGHTLSSYLHVLGNYKAVASKAAITEQGGFYAEDYGQKYDIKTLCFTAANKINIALNLKSLFPKIGV